MDEKLREELADYAHIAWCRWMNYLFSRGRLNDDGTFTIPVWAMKRWMRQIETPYDDLPDNEKLNDRLEADKILEIINNG